MNWTATLLEGDDGARGAHFVADDHPVPDEALRALIAGSRRPRVVKSQPKTNPIVERAVAQAGMRLAGRGLTLSRTTPAAERTPAPAAATTLAKVSEQAAARAVMRPGGPDVADVVRSAAAHAGAPLGTSATRKATGKTFADVLADLRARGPA